METSRGRFAMGLRSVLVVLVVAVGVIVVVVVLAVKNLHLTIFHVFF